MMQKLNSVSVTGHTDVGRVRTNNEDAYIAQYIWDENNILAVVIDGVGGYEGGEVAAELARKCIIDYLERYTNGERIDLLKQAVVEANNMIFSERKKRAGLEHMSCVLTAVLIELEQKRINMIHVGDTRLYQYNCGKLIKLSHDHSLIGYREEIGDLTEEEAMRHPQRNLIGRDVGSAFWEEGNNDCMEIALFPLLPHSILLLCSDGLYDMQTSAQIKEVLRQEVTLDDKANALILAANDAGGCDNVTVVLVETKYTGDEFAAEERESIAPGEIDENEVETEDRAGLPESTVSCFKHRRSRIWRCILIILYSLLLWAMGYVCGKYLSIQISWDDREAVPPVPFPSVDKDTAVQTTAVRFNNINK